MSGSRQYPISDTNAGIVQILEQAPRTMPELCELTGLSVPTLRARLTRLRVRYGHQIYRDPIRGQYTLYRAS